MSLSRCHFCLSFNIQQIDGGHIDRRDPFDRWGRALNSPKKDARGGTRTHDLALGLLACYRWAREVTSPTASRRKQSAGGGGGGRAGSGGGAGPAGGGGEAGHGGGGQQGRRRPTVVGDRRAWGTRRRRKHTSRYAPLTSSPLSSLVTQAVGDGFQSNVLQHR